MASKEIEVIGYCDELVATDESDAKQTRKVIAVLPKHVWVYIFTYTIEKGKRIALPFEARTLASALTFLGRAAESNNSIVSYELFGETVVKKEGSNGE